MPTLYKYLCEICFNANEIIREEDAREGPGVLLEFRHMSDRDKELNCPKCSNLIVREFVPDRFTTSWGNPFNKKKTCLGPSVDYYPPSRDKKRKEQMPTRHIDMSPRSEERKAELKFEASVAPRPSEVPATGVSAKSD